MKKLRAVLDFVAEKLSITLFAITVVLVVWQVVARYIFSKPIPWTETLAKYLFVWLVLINAAYIFGKREHMCIGYFKEHMSPKVQLVLDFVTEFAILGFAVCILLVGGFMALKVGIPQRDAALTISMGYVYAALPLSGILTTLYTICNIIEKVKACKGGEPS
ncbi:MAG: TRAP transporter small permease [Lachnospiraceae bacterium]|nr:TRAP transporter small permease [Lachnospiraceae bacterium]